MESSILQDQIDKGYKQLASFKESMKNVEFTPDEILKDKIDLGMDQLLQNMSLNVLQLTTTLKSQNKYIDQLRYELREVKTTLKVVLKIIEKPTSFMKETFSSDNYSVKQ